MFFFALGSRQNLVTKKKYKDPNTWKHDANFYTFYFFLLLILQYLTIFTEQFGPLRNL